MKGSKRLISILLTLIMVLALMPVFPFTASAATNPPATVVSVNNVVLGKGHKAYLLNDGVTASATGVLGSSAVAHYDYATGVLTLQGYHFGGIKNVSYRSDYTIKLIGNIPLRRSDQKK